MKNKTVIFVLIGIFAICFIVLSIFFALQGVTASNKRHSYFNAYKKISEEYINSSSEMIQKYGNEFQIEFEKNVQYREVDNEKDVFTDIFLKVFNPKVPENIDEFNASIEMISFKFKIKQDSYKITFEKNEKGELAVSDIEQLKD